jgi:hypothetical protein
MPRDDEDGTADSDDGAFGAVVPVIFFRGVRRASCASTFRLRSPATGAAIMSRRRLPGRRGVAAVCECPWVPIVRHSIGHESDRLPCVKSSVLRACPGGDEQPC